MSKVTPSYISSGRGSGGYVLGWVNQRTVSPGCDALRWAIHVSWGGVGTETSSTSLLRPLGLTVGVEVMVISWNCFAFVEPKFSGLGESSGDGVVSLRKKARTTGSPV